MKKSINILLICLSFLYCVSAEGACWLTVERFMPEGIYIGYGSAEQKDHIPRDVPNKETEDAFSNSYIELTCSDSGSNVAQQTRYSLIRETAYRRAISNAGTYATLPEAANDSPLTNSMCSASDGAYWFTLDKHFDMDISLDYRSIVRQENMVRVCTRSEAGKEFVESYMELDCSDSSIHILQEITYASHSEIVDLSSVPTQWEYVSGLVNEALFRYLCTTAHTNT